MKTYAFLYLKWRSELQNLKKNYWSRAGIIAKRSHHMSQANISVYFLCSPCSWWFEVVVILALSLFFVSPAGYVESLTWFIQIHSPCAYFLLSRLLLFWPKMYHLFGANTLLITSYAHFFSRRAGLRVFFCCCFIKMCIWITFIPHLSLLRTILFRSLCQKIPGFTGGDVESFSSCAPCLSGKYCKENIHYYFFIGV